MPALVPAAARTLAVFEVFAQTQRELTNTELAKYLDAPESSCSDLVNTLIDIGYLKRSQRTRRLYPTGRLFSIAAELYKNDWHAARLVEACEALTERTGESALCGALSNRIVTVQAFSPGRDRLRYTTARGDRISLHVSALGKAILTKLPTDQVVRELGDEPYEKLASNTLTAPKELAQQVERFRKQGWVYLENEGSEGLASVAVSGVFNGEILAFSITGAQPRIKLNQQQYLTALLEVAEEVFDPS